MEDMAGTVAADRLAEGYIVGMVGMVGIVVVVVEVVVVGCIVGKVGMVGIVVVVVVVVVDSMVDMVGKLVEELVGSNLMVVVALEVGIECEVVLK
jgi:hypothetical protein